MFNNSFQVKKELKNYFFNREKNVIFLFKSFASPFIPVLRDAKTKHRRLVTSALCLTSTCSDDGKSSSCNESTSPSTFFQALSLKSAG